MTRFEDWLPQGVIPAVLLPFRADFSIGESLTTHSAWLLSSLVLGCAGLPPAACQALFYRDRSPESGDRRRARSRSGAGARHGVVR